MFDSKLVPKVLEKQETFPVMGVQQSLWDLKYFSTIEGLEGKKLCVSLEDSPTKCWGHMNHF